VLLDQQSGSPCYSNRAGDVPGQALRGSGCRSAGAERDPAYAGYGLNFTPKASKIAFGVLFFENICYDIKNGKKEARVWESV
jgi:hypothetical protein